MFFPYDRESVVSVGLNSWNASGCTLTTILENEFIYVSLKRFIRFKKYKCNFFVDNSMKNERDIGA